MKTTPPNRKTVDVAALDRIINDAKAESIVPVPPVTRPAKEQVKASVEEKKIKKIMLRVSQDLHRKIKTTAALSDPEITMHDWIIQACEEKLERLKREPKNNI